MKSTVHYVQCAMPLTIRRVEENELETTADHIKRRYVASRAIGKKVGLRQMARSEKAVQAYLIPRPPAPSADIRRLHAAKVRFEQWGHGGKKKTAFFPPRLGNIKACAVTIRRFTIQAGDERVTDKKNSYSANRHKDTTTGGALTFKDVPSFFRCTCVCSRCSCFLK